MDSKLAVYGGEPVLRANELAPWPPIDDSDRKMVMASLESNTHAWGPNCDAFEKEFADWNGNRKAIFTNSGTSALHMGLAGCGVGAGDHVLVTAYSWSSSATCVLHHCAIPIFVDIDFDTINMDVEKIEAAITPRTKAIIVVHLHGLVVDMERVLAIARKHHLKVIEDACQAHGALFDGRKAGTFGDCAAFSFNQNKCLCAGEGGMFVSDDDEITERARQVWNFGETRAPRQDRDYHAYALGWMYRGNDMTAAFGRAELAKLDGYQAAVRENAQVLDRELEGLKGFVRPTEPARHAHNWYNYCGRIDFRAVGWQGDPVRFRNAVVEAISAEGVPVSIWQRFILPEMTVFQARNAYGNGFPWSIPGANDGVDYDPSHFPVARRHCDSYIALVQALRAPNGPETMKKVAEGIRKVFETIDQIDPDRILKDS